MAAFQVAGLNWRKDTELHLNVLFVVHGHPLAVHERFLVHHHVIVNDVAVLEVRIRAYVGQHFVVFGEPGDERRGQSQ